MAANLLRAGFRLTVHNRTREREEPLAALGASRARSPGEAANQAQFVIVIVTDTSDVEEVLFSEEGVAARAPKGAIVIDMSTIDPRAAAEFAARLGERGIAMIDAPVSGGTEGAQAGTLSIMAGGGERDVAAARPILEVLGSRVTHIGPIGSGQMTKAINQVIVASTFLAVAEGVRLGLAAGLDMERVIEAVGAGAASSWALTHRAPKMLRSEYPLGFKVRLHRKDLRIALGAAARLGIDLPGASLVADLEDALIREGFGDEDMSALAEAIKRAPQ